MIPVQKHMRSEAGFTLVELAIVMIIIGLLIAGVLKGQALISNARVTSTVAQLKAIDAAVSTFKDTYAGIPGDLLNVAARLPNCTAAPCTPGAGGTQGNGAIDDVPGVGMTANDEAGVFFVQLTVANLITGLAPNVGAESWGGNYPATKIDGAGLTVGSASDPANQLTTPIAAIGTTAGMFLTISADPTQNVAGNAIKPTDAGRIDAKLDDGVPASGDVVGVGGAAGAATDCSSTNDSTGVYNGTTNSATCGLYVHIQG